MEMYQTRLHIIDNFSWDLLLLHSTNEIYNETPWLLQNELLHQSQIPAYPNATFLPSGPEHFDIHTNAQGTIMPWMGQRLVLSVRILARCERKPQRSENCKGTWKHVHAYDYLIVMLATLECNFARWFSTTTEEAALSSSHKRLTIEAFESLIK